MPDTAVEALEADLSLWGARPGVLVHTAREIASRLDGDVSHQDLAKLSLELRQVLKAIREQNAGGPSEVDRFLASITADEFSG